MNTINRSYWTWRALVTGPWATRLGLACLLAQTAPIVHRAVGPWEQRSSSLWIYGSVVQRVCVSGHFHAEFMLGRADKLGQLAAGQVNRGHWLGLQVITNPLLRQVRLTWSTLFRLYWCTSASHRTNDASSGASSVQPPTQNQEGPGQVAGRVGVRTATEKRNAHVSSARTRIREASSCPPINPRGFTTHGTSASLGSLVNEGSRIKGLLGASQSNSLWNGDIPF